MRHLFAATALAALVVACGGGAAPSTNTPTQPPNGSAGPGTPGAPTAAPTQGPAASLTPGGISFRVINLYRDDSGAPAPVDIYMRTQGLVEAAAVETPLAYGTATGYFNPPDPGTVVVTVAGAGDPTCVIDCPHFIAESSTNFGEGDTRTIILYGDGSLELWHNPEPGSVGTTGNALAPADPSTALLYVVGVALQEADFGLRLGFDGVAGCQVNRTSEGILVGGNQIAVFAFPGDSDVLLYDNRDSECAEDPVGGPFTVTGDPGTRALLVLFGRPSEMEGLVLDL